MNHRGLLFKEKPGPRSLHFNSHILPVLEDEHTPVFIPLTPAVTPEIRLQAEQQGVEQAGICKEIIALQGHTTDEIEGNIKPSPRKTASHRFRPEPFHE